jgi:hypothetical protein
VTNALIKKELEYLTRKMEEWHKDDCHRTDEIKESIAGFRAENREWCASTEKRLRELEQWKTRSDERWQKHYKTHDDLNRTGVTGGIVGYIGLIATMAKAFLFDK